MLTYNYIHVFLISALVPGERQASRSGRFTLVKEPKLPIE
jgi:hypothetical protein